MAQVKATARGLRVLNLLADCLLKAMAAQHEDEDNVTEPGQAKEAMDLLYFSNPHIIEWLHELTAYRPCVLVKTVKKLTESEMASTPLTVMLQPRTGPRFVLPGIPGHQHMMDVDGRLTCGCIVDVAGGGASAKPDAGLSEVR